MSAGQLSKSDDCANQQQRIGGSDSAVATAARSSHELRNLHQARSQIVWCAALHITRRVRGRIATLRNESQVQVLSLRQHCRRAKVRGTCTLQYSARQRGASQHVGLRRGRRARAISARGSRNCLFTCSRDASALDPRTFELLFTRHCARNRNHGAVAQLQLCVVHSRAQQQRITAAIVLVAQAQ